MEDPGVRYQRHQRRFFYCLVGGLLTIVAFGLLKLLFPFAMAWLLALLLQPTVRKLSAATGLSRRVASILLLLLTLTAGGGLLFWLGVRLTTELPKLAEGLAEGAEALSAQWQAFSRRLHKLPLLSAMPEEEWGQLTGELLREGVEKLSARLTSFAGSLLISLPGGLFVAVIFLMAAFYLTADFEKVSRYLSSLLPRRAVQRLGGLRRQLFSTTLSYLRAYLILLAITFGELFLVFLLMKIPYAITLSLLIALLDALPAIGVGTVLLPWGAVELLSGDWKRGLILCGVWLFVTLIRQFMEPRIVGAQLGLHPLAALVAVYAGFRLLGFWGLLLAPVAAILLRGILDSRRQWILEHDR